MESARVGSGGLAVRTKESVALPPPQFEMQPPPGAPLQDASKIEVKSRSTTAEVWRVIRVTPRGPRIRLARDLRGEAKRHPRDRIYRLAHGVRKIIRKCVYNC